MYFKILNKIVHLIFKLKYYCSYYICIRIIVIFLQEYFYLKIDSYTILFKKK